MIHRSTEMHVTRLADLPPAQAKRLAELECPNFTTAPWVTTAIVTPSGSDRVVGRLGRAR